MEHREHSSDGPSVFDVRAGARCVVASQSGDTVQSGGNNLIIHVSRALETLPHPSPKWSGEVLNVLFVDAGSRPASAIWQTS
jgi:hypothetical protein